MKKKSVKISIAEPCHADWSEMTPNEQGKFCASCAKPVIDFSSSSDMEIVQFLNAHKGQKTCGRFKANQLDRPMTQYTYQSSYSQFNLRAVMMGATLASMLGLESCRSEEPILMGDVAATEQVESKTSNVTTENSTAQAATLVTDDTLEVVKMGEMALLAYDHTGEKRMSGMVSGGEDEPKVTKVQMTILTSDNIEIGKGFSKDDGSFQLDLDWKKKPYSVVFSKDGYTKRTVVLESEPSLQELNIEMYNNKLFIQGDIKAE